MCLQGSQEQLLRLLHSKDGSRSSPTVLSSPRLHPGKSLRDDKPMAMSPPHLHF